MLIAAPCVKPWYGSKPHAHQQVTRLQKCVTYMQWNITQPLKEWNTATAAMWIDLENIQWNKLDKDKYFMISFIYRTEK